MKKFLVLLVLLSVLSTFGMEFKVDVSDYNLTEEQLKTYQKITDLSLGLINLELNIYHLIEGEISEEKLLILYNNVEILKEELFSLMIEKENVLFFNNFYYSYVENNSTENGKTYLTEVINEMLNSRSFAGVVYDGIIEGGTEGGIIGTIIGGIAGGVSGGGVIPGGTAGYIVGVIAGGVGGGTGAAAGYIVGTVEGWAANADNNNGSNSSYTPNTGQCPTTGQYMQRNF